jgi:CheY-like chemotaxis protein
MCERSYGLGSHGGPYRVSATVASGDARVTGGPSNSGDGNGHGNGGRIGDSVAGAGAAAASKSRHHILIVEDHEDTARAIYKLLMKEGHDVRVERTIAGAIAYCQAPGTQVELLIADITLPDGDGWGLMRKLTEICNPLVGIAFSGHGMPDDLHKSKLAGFSEHLTKPVLFQDLLSAIRRVMATAQSRMSPPPLADSGSFRQQA